MNENLCVICGNILPKYRTKICSDLCYKERNRQRQKQWREEHRVTKYCVMCGAVLPAYKMKCCSELCSLQYKKQYSKQWRERNSEYVKQYCEENNERLRQYDKQYYLENREHKKQQKRRRYRKERGLPEDWDLSRESTIEVIMRRWLQDFNVNFIKQHYINLKVLGANWTRVDFFIEPNICLYSDGDYHHGLEIARERDVKINKALEAGDYIVIRISESDILTGIRPIEILELVQ